MKKVILLGSTGSIGKNTIKVINRLKKFKITGIAAYSNHRMLIQQAHKLRPSVISIINEKKYGMMKKSCPRAKILCREDGIYEMVERCNADIIICAFASAIGIHAIIRAIEKKMRIGLATKEVLVSFGDIVMKKVKQAGTELIPIDSEHSALYQCLEGRKRKDVKSLILTASGGPFLHKPISQVKKADVLNHPVWKMGPKITVDSATMMNKGLEVIEAYHLFNMPPEKIEVAIHPEAICHSLVQFLDGTILAQLSIPDMKIPIQYALTAPARVKSQVKFLDIKKFYNLTFMPPNKKKFPCLRYAYYALKKGKSMPAVLNAANEECVKLFLDNKLNFCDIPGVIRKVLNKHIPKKGDIHAYQLAENWSKETVRSIVC